MTSLTLADRNGKPCPCGSGKNFEDCCGPVIAGTSPARDAEQLMRSRFTAHVIDDQAYLHRTYAGTAGQPFKGPDGSEPVKWTRLVIHSHEPEFRPDFSYVDFSAYFDDEGTEQVLHEKSEFQRANASWLYTRSIRNGPAPRKLVASKVGRNDPCPCGSGKKYKNCHLGKDARS